MAHQFKVGGTTPEGNPLLFCEACGTFSNQPAASQPCPNRKEESSLPPYGTNPTMPPYTSTPTMPPPTTFQPVIVATNFAPNIVKCDVNGCNNAGASVCVVCDNPICLHHTTMNPRALCPDCQHAVSVYGLYYGGIGCYYRYARLHAIIWLVVLIVCIILIITGASDLNKANALSQTATFFNGEQAQESAYLAAGLGALIPGCIFGFMSLLCLCSVAVRRNNARNAFRVHNNAVDRLQKYQRVMMCSNNKLDAKYNARPIVPTECNPVDTVRRATA